MLPLHAVSVVGLFVMLTLAWLLSRHRFQINPRIILLGILMQYLLAIFILKTSWGAAAFDALGEAIQATIVSSEYALRIVFGGAFELGMAFNSLPVIIVLSALIALLYYVRVMSLIVQSLGWVMQRTMGTSGAETLTAAANIFLGQTAAPLVARPYLNKMTDSELMTIMVSGFATIALGMMAVYITMGISATHLLAASVIAAPGAIVIAKIMQPELHTTESGKSLDMAEENPAVNMIDAVTRGATEGLHMTLSVVAMLIAFIALVHLANSILGAIWPGLTFEWIMSYLFWPLAWLMGFPLSDCSTIAELLGTRFVLNEFLAFQGLAETMSTLDERSQILAIYAMCGFANLGSIGVQVGGLGIVVPSRQGDLARMGFRAMIGGTLANFLGACVVGSIL